MKRQLVFYGQRIWSFLARLDDDTRDKLEWTLELIRTLDRIPIKYFKHLEGTDGLFEIRTEWMNQAVRIFCFFDEGTMIILVHGFIKKKQKTPEKELKIAQSLMQLYYEEKNKK